MDKLDFASTTVLACYDPNFIAYAAETCSFVIFSYRSTTNVNLVKRFLLRRLWTSPAPSPKGLRDHCGEFRATVGWRFLRYEGLPGHKKCKNALEYLFQTKFQRNAGRSFQTATYVTSTGSEDCCTEGNGNERKWNTLVVSFLISIPSAPVLKHRCYGLKAVFFRTCLPGQAGICQSGKAPCSDQPYKSNL